MLPPHLQRLHHCNTIARLLRNIRPSPPTPRLYAIHHTILVMAILCKGQICGPCLPRRRCPVVPHSLRLKQESDLQATGRFLCSNRRYCINIHNQPTPVLFQDFRAASGVEFRSQSKSYLYNAAHTTLRLSLSGLTLVALG